MKKKVGTILDEELVYKAKQFALANKQTLSQVFENAIRLYMVFGDEDTRLGEKNVAKMTQGAMKTSPSVLKAVMEEDDMYETG